MSFRLRVIGVLCLLGAQRTSASEKLIASNSFANIYFGQAVDVDGDCAIVGSLNAGLGNAYVFCKESNTDAWPQVARLTLNSGPSSRFGSSVSIDGDCAVVGGYGYQSAYLACNANDGDGWQLRHRLYNPSGRGGSFGFSVDIHGDCAIVGAPHDDGRGSAFIFCSVYGYYWEPRSLLRGWDTRPDDLFGWSVSMDGDCAIVGGWRQNASRGSAYIFCTSDGWRTWQQVAKLLPDTIALASFGFSVSISGNCAIVGAFTDDDQGPSSGSAYIFCKDSNDGTWPQVAKLVAPDAAVGDGFGRSVSIDGNCAIVGSWHDDAKGESSGSAYFFCKDTDGEWDHVSMLTADDGSAGDEFGTSVSISGEYGVVGAMYGDTLTRINGGSAHVFHLPPPTVEPTSVPTTMPTAVPTAAPTTEPTAVPTAVPTVDPTAVPTTEPTVVPSVGPLCADGVKNAEGNVCCAKSCGTCGGCFCEAQGYGVLSGADYCCPGTIADLELTCENSDDVGCLLGQYVSVAFDGFECDE